MRRTAIAVILALACAALAHAATPDDCWALRKHGHDAEAQACFDALTRSSEAYDRAEGFWGLSEWEQANAQFRMAMQPAGAKPIYKVRWGLLLHERFNDSDAEGLFQEALAKDPTLAQADVGMALVSEERFDGHSMDYAAKAIALNPKLAKAHELMADLALENDDRETAATEADKAIALEPDALDAMAIHGVLELLANRSPDAWFARIQAVNPHYGQAYSLVAHQLEMHYRYEDAVTDYRKAIEVEPDMWSAYSGLGLDLMRLGQEDEPYKDLELAYNNGYRDAATVNSLRLLDSYKNFDTFRDSTTIIRLYKSESALLLPYVRTELHAIIAAYTKKYQMTLPGPVQVEMYPNHEDFAVRTRGMPGLGALGVTFGTVVAMDSPSGRKPGDFNWGSTLWHEMSHVFVLTATNHRVPRWFTEGLAVHEEGYHSAEWKNRATPDVIVAIHDKKLLPVAQLDRGFVYPSYPGQVIISYFQAGTICDYIGEKWGVGKLLDMVHSYAQPTTTSQVIEQDLDMTPEEFDKQYLAWIDKQYGAEVRNFNEWRTELHVLATAAEQKDYKTVLGQGPAVVALYPQYVDSANAYEMMAAADKATGDAKAEEAILTEYEHEGGQSPDALKRLADLELAAGQNTDAIATLERINYIYPVNNEDLHHRLGDLLYAQKDYAAAIGEYNALLASNPVDKAGAELALAQAYFADGQKDQAQTSVLAALEIAPNYRPALKLLLELQGTPQN